MSQNTDTNQSTGATVLAEVAAALGASTGDVRTRLVKALTERELLKRVDMLDKALVKRAQLFNELNNMRAPAKKAFALVDGKMVEVQAVYTPEEKKKHDEDMKQHNKKVKEATEKLAKFDSVLETAFTGAPEELEKAFAKLGKALSGGGGGDESEKSEE
jgi:hypothetical protein